MNLRTVVTYMLFMPFFSPQIQAFGFSIPSFPKAREETAPKIPSPYKQCLKPLASQNLEQLLDCAEQEFWHGFSDGRLKVRQETLKTLTDILRLTNQHATSPERGRLLALRGYLKLALALENGRMSHLLLGDLEADFNQAKRLDPDHKVYDTFLDTIVMAKAAVFGRWQRATELAIPAFKILADNPVNLLALSGTTIGFPINTGIPQLTVDYLDRWVCPDDLANFCYDNTSNAPYARPGLNFHFAEAYARIGREEQTRYYLEAAQSSPGFSEWPYRHLVEEPLSDMASYMEYWRSFKDGDSAFDKVYANQNFGCVMCHGR